jgi:hypothetical protein
MDYDFTDRQGDNGGETAASAAAGTADALELFGPAADRCTIIEPEAAEAALRDVFAILSGLLTETCLESEIEGLLWSFTNAFHTRMAACEAKLEANDGAIRASRRHQDGSEVRSVEIEELLAIGQALSEKQEAFETLRDCAAGEFAALTGSLLRPRAGSLTSRQALTAAVIEARDFLEAQAQAKRERHLPQGTRIAVAGGPEFEDHALIWGTLDKAQAKHGAIVLLHGGTARGAEHIASLWAKARGLPQVLFKPDWRGHGKAAPFKRNDLMLESLPVGVIVFGGAGVAANLADKAKARGIPVWRFASPGA